MRFTKMQGCGNDYIYIDGAREAVPEGEKPSLVRSLSDRHFGIGGDGVIFINPVPDGSADFEMEMYNADGTRAEMCGNGIRCVGAYVWEKRLTDRKDLTIVSAGAKKYLRLDTDDAARRVNSVTVDMGQPILTPAAIPADLSKLPDMDIEMTGTDRQVPTALFRGASRPAGGPELPDPYRAFLVSMGNPHAVVILPEEIALEDFPLETVGPWFERHPVFPNRTNTEFVHIDSPREVHMRVWERGSGETLACGTGCCAIAVACALSGLTGDEILVHVLGGDIRCRYDRGNDRVYMTGPAVTVFEGEIRI